jgi:hypothetical protein
MIIQQLVLKTIMQALGFGGGFFSGGFLGSTGAMNISGVPSAANFGLSSITGGGANFFSGFAASAKGNVFGRNGIQKFARGGIVGGPTIFPFANGIGVKLVLRRSCPCGVDVMGAWALSPLAAVSMSR